MRFSMFCFFVLISQALQADPGSIGISHNPNQSIVCGKLYSVNAHQFFPSSIEEIQKIIQYASKSGRKISVIGAGMSQGRQAISSDDGNIVLNTKRLNKIEINPKTKIAKVGSGSTWCDLQNAANKYGLAVDVMQASNIFSVGGSISANCHGWSHKSGTIRNTVLAMTVVNCRGEVVKLTPDDELFDYVIGGYGWFGMIVEAEILLTNNVEYEESGVEVVPSSYYSYFLEKVKDNTFIDMHIYRLSLDPENLFETGVAVNWVKQADIVFSGSLKDEPENGSVINRLKIGAVRKSKTARKIAWNVEKKLALTARKGTRNELMRPPIKFVLNDSEKQTEWLQEYFVKGKDLNDFLVFLKSVLTENSVSVFNASVRFVKQDTKSALSYSPKEDCFAVVLFFNQRLAPSAIQKTSVWVKQVIDYLISHDGTYYLPYQNVVAVEQFKACYPNWQAVLEKKQSEDPQMLFENGLFAHYIVRKNHTDSYFRKVFCSDFGQRSSIDAFLRNVYMQLDRDKFFNLINEILKQSDVTEDAIYTQLLESIAKTKKDSFFPRSSFKALNALKSDLSCFVAELLCDKKEIKGYVEIGYNGRLVRPLKKRLSIAKPIYVQNDTEAFKDFFERGAKPYNKFIPLQNYDPITIEQIPTASVDLVACYIGLHHIPPDKLDPYIASIARMLRPGGSFILMDHDASTQELKELAHVVHSIFNAAAGVTLKENREEVRNFQSLAHWINRVEQHDLRHNKDMGSFVREGDPTMNAVIRFDKPVKAIPEMITTSFPDYVRPLEQTYLTAPEWQNVRSAQEYARFVQNEPFYNYPYFRDIGGFWQVFAKSFEAASRESGLSKVAFSDYTLMNLFIGTTMTVEYGVKGLLSLPLSLLPTASKSQNITETDKERLRSINAYGSFINHTPFYEYSYFEDIKKYWSSFTKECSFSKTSLRDFFMGGGFTLEYLTKGFISAPMHYIFTSPGVKEAEMIHLLVEDKQNTLVSLDARIEVVESLPNHLKHIKVPRYLVFTEIIKKFAAHEIQCINIAGQTKIQLDVKIPCDSLVSPSISGCNRLYRFPVPTDSDNHYIAYEVYVNALHEVICQLQHHGAEILYLHDY